MSDTAREAAAAPVAFMSYAHHDDRKGRITQLRHELEDEVRARTGDPFPIFLDHDNIGLGERWRRRLEEGLAEATFLIPVLSPSFFKSDYCRLELEQFLEHEHELGRDDLILPVNYIDSGWLENDSDDAVEEALRELHERQHFDWRELEARQFSDPKVQRALRELADSIKAAIARTQRAGRAPPPIKRADDPTVATESARARAGLWQELRSAVESSLPAGRQLAIWTLELLTTEPDPETKSSAQQELARALKHAPVEASEHEANPLLKWTLPIWQQQNALGASNPFGDVDWAKDDVETHLLRTLVDLAEFYETRIIEQTRALDGSSVADADQVANLQRDIERLTAIDTQITTTLDDFKAMRETFQRNT